mmetsp:Transcript_7881/g.17010  ORF Transcript_7881/g.17010 Transcript_7881/m.17010 type:complete len:231 (-) Transcript_7881:376-1068(-)
MRTRRSTSPGSPTCLSSSRGATTPNRGTRKPMVTRMCASPPSVSCDSVSAHLTPAPWSRLLAAPPATETTSLAWTSTLRPTLRPLSRTRNTPANMRRNTATVSATVRTKVMISTRRSASTTATWAKEWNTVLTATPTMTMNRKKRRRWSFARWLSAVSLRSKTITTVVVSSRRRRKSSTSLVPTALTLEPASTLVFSLRRPAPSLRMNTVVPPLTRPSPTESPSHMPSPP